MAGSKLAARAADTRRCSRHEAERGGSTREQEQPVGLDQARHKRGPGVACRARRMAGVRTTLPTTERLL